MTHFSMSAACDPIVYTHMLITALNNQPMTHVNYHCECKYVCVYVCLCESVCEYVCVCVSVVHWKCEDIGA